MLAGFYSLFFKYRKTSLENIFFCIIFLCYADFPFFSEINPFEISGFSDHRDYTVLAFSASLLICNLLKFLIKCISSYLLLVEWEVYIQYETI